jgi:hypothetical protein
MLRSLWIRETRARPQTQLYDGGRWKPREIGKEKARIIACGKRSSHYALFTIVT